MPKLIRIMIQLPEELKDQLDGLKQRGYTTSGFIRAVVDRELRKADFNRLQTRETGPIRDDDDQRRLGRRMAWGS